MSETQQKYGVAEFRSSGFRCIEPTKVQFSDGSSGIVQAFSWLKRLENRTKSEWAPSAKAAFGIYSISIKGKPGLELVSEISLEQRLRAAFSQLN